MVYRPLQNQAGPKQWHHQRPKRLVREPRDLITAIERIVHVSVESTKIIENLPAQVTPD